MGAPKEMGSKSGAEASPGPAGRRPGLASRFRDLAAPALGLGSLEMLAHALAFAGMAIKFRYFGAATLGVISYFGALGEIPSAFYAHFNKGLVRFVPTAGRERKVELLLSSLLVQAGILVLFALGVAAVAACIPQAAFWRGRTVAEGSAVPFVAAFTAALVPLALLQSLLGSMAQGLQRYGTVQAVKIGNAAALLVGLLVLHLADVERVAGLWAYYWILVASGAASILFLGSRVAGWAGLSGQLHLLRPGRLRASFRSVWRENFRYYTLPLQATAVLAYVKENLAVLFLGQMGMMAEAGVYNLANKVYGLPRRFIPGLVALMMPRLVVAAEADAARFRRKYDDFAWLNYLAHLAMATALLAGLPLIRAVFDAGGETTLAAVFFLFSSNLVINAQAHNNLHIIELGKDMRFYMISVFLRTAVVVAITAVLVPRMGNVGATLALVSSTVVICLLQAWDTRKTELWTWSQNVWQFLLWLAAMAAWALLFILFPGTFAWSL